MSRARMHKGGSQQLTKKRWGANRGQTGRNGPMLMGPGWLALPVFVPVRDAL
jgi:hypothetical protein